MRFFCVFFLLRCTTRLLTIQGTIWEFHHPMQNLGVSPSNATRMVGFVSFVCSFVSYRKFNIAPENGWLEDYLPFGRVTFQGRAVKLGRCTLYHGINHHPTQNLGLPMCCLKSFVQLGPFELPIPQRPFGQIIR